MSNPTRLIFVLVVTLASSAFAQSFADNYRLQLDQIRRQQVLDASRAVPAGQRSYLDYGAYFTFDYLTVDDNLGENHVLRQYDFIAYSRLNLDNAHELFLRFRTTYRDFNDGDSFDGRGDELLDPDLDLGYYKFDLARHLGAYENKQIDGNVIAKFGRDIVYWGNGLTLGQVLDGAMIDFTSGPFALSAIAGITPVRTVDFDSSRPDFDFNTRRGFYGLMASTQVGTHRPYLYGLIQQDYNKDEDFVLGSVTTEFRYDSYYLGIGSSGNFGDRLVYGAELVYEMGRGKSNSFVVSGPFLSPIDQTTEDVQAFAGDFRLDYLFQDSRFSRMGAEFLFASGDDDRLSTSNTFGGNATGTDDSAFNAFGLINTGQAFAPVVSNLLMLRGGVSTYPFQEIRQLKRLQVGADFFVFGKADNNAPIDEVTKDQTYLGFEPDIYLNWRITSDITLALRYGVFFPDSGAFDNDDPRQFFSSSITVAF